MLCTIDTANPLANGEWYNAVVEYPDELKDVKIMVKESWWFDFSTFTSQVYKDGKGGFHVYQHNFRTLKFKRGDDVRVKILTSGRTPSKYKYRWNYGTVTSNLLRDFTYEVTFKNGEKSNVAPGKMYELEPKIPEIQTKRGAHIRPRVSPLEPEPASHSQALTISNRGDIGMSTEQILKWVHYEKSITPFAEVKEKAQNNFMVERYFQIVRHLYYQDRQEMYWTIHQQRDELHKYIAPWHAWSYGPWQLDPLRFDNQIVTYQYDGGKVYKSWGGIVNGRGFARAIREQYFDAKYESIQYLVRTQLEGESEPHDIVMDASDLQFGFLDGDEVEGFEKLTYKDGNYLPEHSWEGRVMGIQHTSNGIKYIIKKDVEIQWDVSDDDATEREERVVTTPQPGKDYLLIDPAVLSARNHKTHRPVRLAPNTRWMTRYLRQNKMTNHPFYDGPIAQNVVDGDISQKVSEKHLDICAICTCDCKKGQALTWTSCCGKPYHKKCFKEFLMKDYRRTGRVGRRNLKSKSKFRSYLGREGVCETKNES